MAVMLTGARNKEISWVLSLGRDLDRPLKCETNKEAKCKVKCLRIITKDHGRLTREKYKRHERKKVSRSEVEVKRGRGAMG